MKKSLTIFLLFVCITSAQAQNNEVYEKKEYIQGSDTLKVPDSISTEL